MRIGVVSSIAPFVNGGGRLIVDWTTEALRDAGHEVEEVLIPMDDDPRHLLAQMVGIRTMPLRGFDRIITIRWPAHLVRHENKVAWFIHHYRPLFDLWDTPHRNVPDDVEGRSLRELVRKADTLGLRECRQVFTNSRTVTERLERYNGIASTPLLPPIGGDLRRFVHERYGEDIVYPARLEYNKRQLLAVAAMAHTTTPVRLVLMGRSNNPGYLARIRLLVREHSLEDRVTIHDRWVPESEKVAALAGCLAVAYLPLDEDSYGYASLEAAHSRKCVVTARDSGGVLELIEDRVNGLVAEPDPHALAAAFDELYLDRRLAEQLGTSSFERMAGLGITWDTVVEALVGQP
jgi:glycosyltransferase involved in cell wall biosynthesis